MTVSFFSNVPAAYFMLEKQKIVSSNRRTQKKQNGRNNKWLRSKRATWAQNRGESSYEGEWDGEQSEQSCQPAGSNQGSPTKIPTGGQPCHYQRRAQPEQQQSCLPSARTVKGGSPGLLEENWPPREVIRKQRLKKPIPTTKILHKQTQRVTVLTWQLKWNSAKLQF